MESSMRHHRVKEDSKGTCEVMQPSNLPGNGEDGGANACTA